MSRNVFFTTTVHLSSWPPERIKGDPGALHNQDEAIQKMHRFCHEIYKVPITWIVTWGALQKYEDILIPFCREWGDEVGIMEYGIDTSDVMNADYNKYQGWVEEAKMTRPDTFQSNEPEVYNAKTWSDMTYNEQVCGISYLKKSFEDILGMKVKTFASPHINGDTIKILRETGFSCIWGYNWNYFCEGINNKGCLPYSFYPSLDNHNIPATQLEEYGPLAVHWGVNVPSLWMNVDTMSRRTPAWCLNPMEMANRSLGLDAFNFDRLALESMFKQADWNPFVHIPLQLEATWMDEGPDLEGYYDQFPDYNPRCTEVFYRQIEYCLRNKAIPLTMADFAAWHKKNISKTAEMMHFIEDPVPTLRGNGKDRAYDPVVVYGNEKKQYFFSKSVGFNYIRRYDYEKTPRDASGYEEYPFDTEPRVYLKTKSSIQILSGIHINESNVRYEMSGLTLTAYHDDPGYAALIWEANIPRYVMSSDIKTTGMTGFRTIREKNALLIFADLKKGNNEMTFASDLPEKYIRLKSIEKIGRRYEVWIENDKEETGLCELTIRLEPGLKIGGIWWDGQYHRTPSVYGNAWYDRDTGMFYIGACYPGIFPLLSGLTRMSVELL